MRHTFSLIAVGLTILSLAGCNVDRMNKLEKENQALSAQLKSTNLDLQSKCSKDAKTWFGQNWSHPEGTIKLEFVNHYNQAMNKCFILVTWRFALGLRGSFSDTINLSDIYENKTVAEFGQNRSVGSDGRSVMSGVTCIVADAQCASQQEFSDRVNPYMSK